MTRIAEAWAEYYRPGMSSAEAQAFQAGFKAALNVPQEPEWEYGWALGGVKMRRRLPGRWEPVPEAGPWREA